MSPRHIEITSPPKCHGSISQTYLLPYPSLPLLTPHHVFKHPVPHILSANRIPNARRVLGPHPDLLFSQCRPVCQQARPHDHKLADPGLHFGFQRVSEGLFHGAFVLVGIGEEDFVEGQEGERDVAGAGGDAGGGDDEEERFYGGTEEGEGSEDGGGGGGANGGWG